LGDRAAPPIDIRDKHPECSLTEPGTNEVRFAKPRTGRVHARNLRPAQAIVYGFPQRQAVGTARIVGNVGRPTRFWSLTMYELPASLLVANPINRYLVNSPMLPQFKKDADGGITIYVQNESPGKDKEPNWLPAPKGPFLAWLRLYWPKEEALERKWATPKLAMVK
jgi:Protein of unknown function (DUF1214)